MPRAKRDTIYSSLRRGLPFGHPQCAGGEGKKKRKKEEEEKEKKEKIAITPGKLVSSNSRSWATDNHRDRCGIGEMCCDRSLFFTFLSEWETRSSSRGNVSFLSMNRRPS